MDSQVSAAPARRPLGTTVEVAAFLGVPIATLHVWRTRKKGPPASRVGKHLRYAWPDVDAWVAVQQERPRPSRAARPAT